MRRILFGFVIGLLLAAQNAEAGVRTDICHVFGRYCGQAVRVAYCESRLNVWARNGVYLGLFQMGPYARARYGHSWTAYGQSRAAFRYFVAAGHSWRPWTCGWAA